MTVAACSWAIGAGQTDSRHNAMAMPRSQADQDATARAIRPLDSAGDFFEEGVIETVVVTQGIVRDPTANPAALWQQMAR